MTYEFSEEFINDITTLSSSSNATDENINVPILQLQHNIKYLLNILSTNSSSSVNSLLSLIYGNLFDYDSVGNKIFFNGGNLDSFEKKNTWIAINDNVVVNDTAIQSSGADNLLVYKDIASTTDETGDHWRFLQREIYIPQHLRGSELVFAIKGTGVYLTDADSDLPFTEDITYCTSKNSSNIEVVEIPLCYSPGTTATSGTGTSGTSGIGSSGTSGTTGTSGIPGITCIPDLSSGCYGRYEDIGIEILGAVTTVEEIVKIGPWPYHDLYANAEWGPKFRTAFVKFKVGPTTNSIKIRIRRTRSDGAIAISQMFLGGLPTPYSGYVFNKIDINELYDFSTGFTKWNVTTVNGRHAGSLKTKTQLSNLLVSESWAHLQQFNKVIDTFIPVGVSGASQVSYDIPALSGGDIPSDTGWSFGSISNSKAMFKMTVDGSSPGLAYIGINYFTKDNSFSTVVNDTSGCGVVKFKVHVKTIVQSVTPNISASYATYTYSMPINYDSHVNGDFKYFEIYDDFYANLPKDKGAILYFIIERDTSNSDNFGGDCVIISAKTGIAVPEDNTELEIDTEYNTIFVPQPESVPPTLC